jgi:hypothetical protein
MTRILRHLKLVSVPPSIAPPRVRQEHSIGSPKPTDTARGLVVDIRVAEGCLLRT